MEKGGCIYIMTNQHHTTLYIGVTADLVSRVYEHKNKLYPGSFTYRYNIDKLVYYETFHDITEAIQREKWLKRYTRKEKERLINKFNPGWEDLYEVIGRTW